MPAGSNKALIVALALLVAAAAPPPPVAVPAPQDRNIVYGMYSGLALLLDVRRPAHSNGFAVLHIPGSGFQAPTVWDAEALKDGPITSPQELLEAGFTVFTINHRAAPRFRFPAAVEDAQRAARFIRAHAADYGVRSDRLAVVGGSSGANLAAMLATVGENNEDGTTAPVLRPDCVVAAMAPLDLTPLGLDGAATGYTVSYLGHPPAYGSTAEKRSFDADYAAASPIAHVSATTSPMLLLHGDKDGLVPIDQSRRFLKALIDAGGKGELVVMTGVGHSFRAPYTGFAAQWLTRCMAANRR
jgi:acetyl esterase/lipase